MINEATLDQQDVTFGTVPRGQRVYAVGDVHGRADLLRSLLRQIDRDDGGRPNADTRLILLGDLIDRGPDSAGVLERVRALVAEPGRHTTVLMGNHEDMFLKAIDEGEAALTSFLRHGGHNTLASFGLESASAAAMDGHAIVAWIRAHVPDDLIDWMRGFPDQVRVGGYLFVHAGIRPGVPLDRQSPRDLRWIRPEFLDDPGDHAAMIVHGHTISERVDERHNRIGLDTGAYATGVLTAMGFEGRDRWTVQVRG